MNAPHWLRCRYGKWVTTESGELLQLRLGNGVVGRFEYQRRECSVCGKVRIRKERTS